MGEADHRGGVTVDKEYGMTTVDLNNIGYKEEPFVLVADVSQVFYVKDMSTKLKRGKNEDITLLETTSFPRVQIPREKP